MEEKQGTSEHHAAVTRRGSGYGFRCTCGEEPNRSSKQRKVAEGWAKSHEASANREGGPDA